MTHDFDLIVIGAGSAGVRAARVAAQTGARVAIVENFRVGGTCVVRGCVPKKFMVYASEFGRLGQEARGYGWDFQAGKLDFGRFMIALRAEVERLSGIYTRNLENSGVTLLPDRAVLDGAGSVRLEAAGRTLTAERVLIATGGTPARLTGIAGAGHAITSDEIFDLTELPRSIVIAGGGYIAVEFAAIFAGLGVATHLVYRGERVLRGFDEEVRAHVQEALELRGVNVVTNAAIAAITEAHGSDRRFSVALTQGAARPADVVLAAIGRVPATAGLGCERAGIAMNADGAVKVDSYSRTTSPKVWAVGDVTNRMNLTPVAIREGQAFALTEYHGRPTTFDHDLIPTAVFTQPPVGTVGLTEEQARELYGNVDIYKTRFKPMKQALSGDPVRTFMKLVVHPSTNRVLGVHMVGPDAPEIIQAVGIAVKMGATKADFDATCAVHPSIAEELVTLKDKWVAPSA